MKNAWTLIVAVGAIAAGAHAQPTAAEWHARVDVAPDLLSADVTLTLSMEAQTPFLALEHTIFDTLNVAGADLGGITGWQVLNDLSMLTGDLTATDGDSLFNTNAGQLTVFGPFTSDNPIDIITFTWEPAPG